MAWIEGVRGLLLDVDGTLLQGEDPIPGAAEAVERLRRAGYPFRLTTNTTRRPRRAVAEALAKSGIPVREHEVIAPSVLARRRILESGRPRAALLVPEASRIDFDGVVVDDERPDWVVVGDLGSAFTWETVNRAFSQLRAGAALLALHKNRFWFAGHRGVLIDAGAFVAGLEYAAGIEAEVVGKPSRPFFELSLAELGLTAREVLVVGDDPANDCVGGAAAGCRTALVRTGKWSEEEMARSGARPDLLLASVADLP